MSKRKVSDPRNDWPVSKSNRRQLDGESHRHFYLGAGASLATVVRKGDSVSRYQDQILSAAKRTPRFLFRTWHRTSGGATSGQYNTKDAVTPRAFAEGRKSHLLFGMKQTEYDTIATDHVDERKDCSTVFSSWSQSLGFVFKLALQNVKIHHAEDTCICILDTKLLSRQNVIINTVAASQICPYIGIWSEEFLAFGTISGAAYEVLTLEAIQDNIDTFVFYDDMTERYYPTCADWGLTIKHAREIKALLPPRFQAPFAAHLLTLHFPDHEIPADCKRRDQDIHSVLQSLNPEILPSLAVDDTIMQPGYAATYMSLEANRAADQLRDLVIARLGQDRVNALRKSARAPDETPFEREQAYRAAQKKIWWMI